MVGKLTVSVTSAVGLRGSKDGSFGLLVRAACGSLSTNESGDGEATEMTFSAEPTPVTHTNTFSVPVCSKEGIELMANTPMVLNLLEMNDNKADSKKSKKKDKAPEQKELGSTQIDLGPLVFENKREISGSYAIVLNTPQDEADENTVAPSIDVTISMDRHVLSDEQVQGGNMMTITPMGVYSLPQLPLFQAGVPNITYGVTVPLPVGAGLSFNGGVIVAPAGASAEGYEAEYRVDQTGHADEMRTNCETVENRVESLGKSIVFLNAQDQSALIDQTSRTRLIPVEFRRFSKESGKGKSGKASKAGGGSEDELVPGHHGVSYVDISSLIYPGSKELCGAFNVVPYDEATMTEKTGVTREALDEQLFPSKPGSRTKGAPKKDPAAEELAKEQSAVYAEASTYMVVKVKLEKPLIPKRSTESVAASVAELVPLQDLYPKHTMSAEAASAELHNQITTIANQLLDEYRRKSESVDDPVQKRQALFYDLNSTGKFFAYKEQMKRAVVKVVREKFKQTSALLDPRERETFLAELYSYLIKQLHATLNKSFVHNTADLVTPFSIDMDKIRFAAKEAEGRDLFDKAAKYHQECIARRKTDVSCWYDYGCFCMRIGDIAKADECFREAVSINQAHGPSMLLAAVIAWMNEQFDVATALFEAATHYESTGIAWAVRSLYHNLLEDDISADMCMQEAIKVAPKKQVWLDTASFLLNIKVGAFVEGALRELKVEFGERCASGVPPAEASEMAAIFATYHLQQEQYAEALELLDEAITADVTNPVTVGVKGHVLYRSKDFGAARETYKRALDLPGDLSDLEVIRLRLAALYLENADYELAKSLFMQASAKNPSAISWEGVGIASFKLGYIEEAERALAESNMYDNANPKVWGYLSLLCLQTGRRTEAEQTYKYAVRHGLVDADLVAELEAKQVEVGFGQPFVDA